MAAKRRWFSPGSCSSQRQRGFPMPLGQDETREASGRPLRPTMAQSFPIFVHPARSDMGARGVVSLFGQTFVNPIGAGVYAPNRPQASYGIAGQYVDHTIFWAQQTIPTTIPMGPLTSPAELAALLGIVNVQAALRVY